MIQDMHNPEGCCIFYLKVGTCNHLEQSTICLITVNRMGIVRLTVQHDMSSIVSFM